MASNLKFTWRDSWAPVDWAALPCIDTPFTWGNFLCKRKERKNAKRLSQYTSHVNERKKVCRKTESIYFCHRTILPSILAAWQCRKDETCFTHPWYFYINVYISCHFTNHFSTFILPSLFPSDRNVCNASTRSWWTITNKQQSSSPEPDSRLCYPAMKCGSVLLRFTDIISQHLTRSRSNWTGRRNWKC